MASHQSALVLHGARLWKSDLTTAHLCRSDDDHTRRRPAAILHPACGVQAVETADGFRTVPVATAVVQVGLRAPRDGLPFPSRAWSPPTEHSTTAWSQEELEAAVKAHSRAPRHTWRARLLARADGRHESVRETRLAHTMRALGYRFTPQVWVSAGGRRWRADFVLDDDPVIIEFDGLAKYWGGLPDPSRSGCAGPSRRGKWREDRLRGTQT